MISIRYPNGLTVTYNSAHYLVRSNTGGWLLYNKDPDKGGEFVAGVMPGAGATVEFVRPCLVNHDGRGARDMIGQLARTPELLREGHHPDLHVLKNALAAFDCRAYRWK